MHLTGFGIAVADAPQIKVSAAAEVITGSLAYMAPEQTGYTDQSIDFRSDLYAFGIALYELMTGVLPFSAADVMGWIRCHIAQEPLTPTAHVPELPAPVASIILKLMAKAQQERRSPCSSMRSIAPLRAPCRKPC
ncbi:MAG TPA: protein kinase [Burkholderiaceae bacterium]|nr:protein kinase [Burkholderiaceae bacterium]